MNKQKSDQHNVFKRQQAALASFGELAVKSPDLDEILNEACRLIGDGLGTDLAKVMELQEDQTALLVKAGVGWKPGVVGQVTVKAEENSSEGHALKTAKPVVSADIDTEKRFYYPDFIKDHGVKALVNVPIIGMNDRPAYGILEVDSREPREFSEDDITFLRAYANLLAAAVERIRGLRELERLNGSLQGQVTDSNRAYQNEQKQRETAEEQLRQSQKMEAVGQLTGGIAHDFNNMLAGILGNLEMIQIRLDHGNIKEIGRYVESAIQVTHRATSLTHRLLAFSRRQTLSPKPTSVNQLILSLEDLITRSIGSAIFFQSVLEGGLWPAYCDPNQLENALLNLAINSRDAMPDGGRVTIETNNVTISPGNQDRFHDIPPGQYVKICVSDTGVGMAPKILRRAIDPFFTTKPTGQGTGLGLSMIYGFVQQSKGHLKIESESGKGTLVHIFLPRYVGECPGTKHEPATPEAPRAQGDFTVLLVDDEDSIRNLSAEVLHDLGYTVITASDGNEALKAIEAGQPIDLLVSDVGLPGGMNGRQLADTAREHRADLKVLFITGYAEQSATEMELLAPGMQIMTKPFSMALFARKVQAMIQST